MESLFPEEYGGAGMVTRVRAFIENLARGRPSIGISSPRTIAMLESHLHVRSENKSKRFVRSRKEEFGSRGDCGASEGSMRPHAHTAVRPTAVARQRSKFHHAALHGDTC